MKVPEANFGALTDCCLKHEYYKQQKDWVAEVRAVVACSVFAG